MRGRMTAASIRVRGQVQGVGFRPFVWRLAQEFGVRGRVLNDPEGVLIEAAGDHLPEFLAAIASRAPPLARVDAVETAPFGSDLPEGFEIAPSRGVVAETRVTPDAATCLACAAEIRAPGRRRGYAFTNGTHCGPRFTILRDLPYDRAQTTMAPFPMCPDCRAEYRDPADRRFHAQPVACPACGPRLWFERGGTEQMGDPVALAVACLRAGGIVAVKGLGGFHLACDATDAGAVALLRQRKRRPSKPFAVMLREADLPAVALPSEADLVRLRDPAAPVVLVPSLGVLPEAVAPGMDRLGVMVPYTPLHHLLLDAFGGVLVMTSGNLSGEPQAIGNDEARAKLGVFADGFLMHDREIARRLDDSVERSDPPMILRRARGRVPGTLPLPPGFAGAPQVLALGGQMKGAICLVKNGQATTSAIWMTPFVPRSSGRPSPITPRFSTTGPRWWRWTPIPATAPRRQGGRRACRWRRSFTITPTLPPAWPRTSGHWRPDRSPASCSTVPASGRTARSGGASCCWATTAT